MVNKEQLLSYSKKFDMELLLKMIPYKSSIQKSIMAMLSSKEESDIVNSKINRDVISKLCKLANEYYSESPTTETLYCLSMSVGTIIKEYDWGTYYISGEGLCELAEMIERK